MKNFAQFVKLLKCLLNKVFKINFVYIFTRRLWDIEIFVFNE